MKEREHIKWRRGRSIPFRWSIKIGGQVPELAEGEIKLFMRNSLGAKVAWPYEIEDGNVLVFDWLGKDQKRGGVYSFTALYHDGLEDQNVLDSCVDIELVESTCEEDDCCGCGDFAIEPVYMEGDFLVTGGTSKGAVRYDKQQDLTDEQKQQAKNNIGVEDEIFVAEYGVTTFAEVKEAYEAGKSIKAVHVQDQSAIEGMLTVASESGFIFSGYANFGIAHALVVVGLSEVSGWTFHTFVPATLNELAAKQDTISDLSAIRSGASAGATAVQPDDLPTFGNIVTHDADEFLPSSTDYIKDAAVSQDGNTLTLTKKNNTQVTFAPSGGGGADPEAVHFTPQTLTEAQKAQARANIADTTRRPFGRNMYPEEFVYRDGSHQLNDDGTWRSGASVFIFKITKKHDRVRETYNRAFVCEGWNETGLVNPVAFSAIKELTQEDVGKYIAVCHTSGYNGPMFSVYGENVWFEDDLTDKEIQAELDVIHSLYRPNEYKFNALTSATTTMYISPLKDCNGNILRHVMGGCDDELGNQAWRYMVNRYDMQYANHCNLLLRHYVQRYNTSGVTSMYCAFSNCRYLESADMRYLDMSSVTSSAFMFNGCSSLTTLDVSGWNVGAVTSMQSMFNGCSSLTTLDVSGWNVGAVTSMQNMFNGCSSLTTLIGGSQDLTKVALYGLNSNLGLNATGIDRASLRAVINGLADRTGQTQLTLTLVNSLKAKLTDEDILVATTKNWRIA